MLTQTSLYLALKPESKAWYHTVPTTLLSAVKLPVKDISWGSNVTYFLRAHLLFLFFLCGSTVQLLVG